MDKSSLTRRPTPRLRRGAGRRCQVFMNLTAEVVDDALSDMLRQMILLRATLFDRCTRAALLVRESGCNPRRSTDVVAGSIMVLVAMDML